MKSSAMVLADFEDVHIGPNYATDEHLVGALGSVVLSDLDFDPATPTVGGTAHITWPGMFGVSGAEGHFIITAVGTAGKIDAFVCTYPNTQRQVRQPAITRDEAGAIVVQPDVVVEPWDVLADLEAFKHRRG